MKRLGWLGRMHDTVGWEGGVFWPSCPVGNSAVCWDKNKTLEAYGEQTAS